mmetsp:Transcript_26346/g.71278  ORF Transcript_26346/g.71278 Transcript_26346/m.71278 type:complete len:118 (-) Transcript_26346:41-394(-)
MCWLFALKAAVAAAAVVAVAGVVAAGAVVVAAVAVVVGAVVLVVAAAEVVVLVVAAAVLVAAVVLLAQLHCVARHTFAGPEPVLPVGRLLEDGLQGGIELLAAHHEPCAAALRLPCS